VVDLISRSSGGETILVVEDTAHVRCMVAAMLAQAGYRVLEAGDGAEALRVLETGDGTEVSLVLADVMMPVMNGLELARCLADRCPELRVMFMSGYIDAPEIRAIGRAVAALLPKPFTASALTKTVRRALDAPWPALAAAMNGSSH
jgi:two-component system, cell cycle sensor histidine kinase and response regulator CckA